MAKRKVSGSYDWVGPVAILGVVGVGIYWLVKNLPGFGPSATTTNNNSTASGQQAATAATQAALAASGQKPTITDLAAQGYASGIWSLANNEDDKTPLQLNAILENLTNTSDYLLVYKYFGTKQVANHWYDLCSQLGIACQAVDLTSFLSLLYAGNNGQDYKSSINSFFN